MTTRYDTHFPAPPWPWEVSNAAPAKRCATCGEIKLARGACTACAQTQLRAVAAKRSRAPNVVQRRTQLVLLMREWAWVTPQDAWDRLGFDPKNDLRAMVRDGVAERIGAGRYVLAEES